jgi:hypothetical protein
MKNHLTYEEVGLPLGHASPKLSYHASGGFLVAHTSPRKSDLPVKRLSIRRVNEERYRPLGDFPPDISVESFVLHRDKPIVYLSTYAWHLLPNDRAVAGGNWRALHRFDLDTLKEEVLVRQGEMILPAGHRRDTGVDLLSVDAAGSALYCRVGLEVADSACTVKRYVAKISLADKVLVPLTNLEAISA